jgi:hypothetical protein
LILLVGIYRRRSPGRCAAEKFPKQFRQQGRSLRRRAVALVAPSELFLRMVRLARLSRRWKSRCCASGASAIATISRAPAPSFRCQRPAPPTPKVTIGRRFTVSPERLTEIVLYLGLERKNSDDARHPQYRSTTKHHMGGMS